MKKPPLLLMIIVLLGVGVLVWQWSKSLTSVNQLPASGTIETTEVPVGSRIGGRIIEVNAAEGDQVSLGTTLLKFDPYLLPAEEAQLQAQLAQAQARLAEMQNGPRIQEVEAARAQYQQAQAQANLVQEGPRSEEVAQAVAARKQAQADAERTRQDLERFELLQRKHVVSQQEYDAVKTNANVAAERLQAAQEREYQLQRGSRPQEKQAARQQAKAAYEQLALLQAGTRPETIKAQRALIASIEAQLARLNTTHQELTVTAPCACEVSTLDLKPGQLIMPNQTVATLTNLQDLWVRVYIPEDRFGQVKVGDVANIHVDAYPQKRFTGKVVQLASKAEFTPRNVQTAETRRMQVFGIKVAIDNTDKLLRPGMPADVTFTVEKQ